jgi:hypothetical protein
MDELLVLQNIPRLQSFGAVFPDAVTPGAQAGWSALVTPYEITMAAPLPGMMALERIELEVWWNSAAGRRTLRLEGYRRTRLTPDQVDWMGSHAVLTGATQ